MMHVTCDRLDNARYGLVVITLVTVVTLVVITVISRDTRQDALQLTQTWITGLALTTPTLMPSGRTLRDPGYANPAIDLRHSPHLPLIHFSPEDLMKGNPKPEKGAIPLSD